MFYAGVSKATADTVLTLESDLIDIHSGRYTYENAVFINARTPFLITCNEVLLGMKGPRLFYTT